MTRRAPIPSLIAVVVPSILRRRASLVVTLLVTACLLGGCSSLTPVRHPRSVPVFLAYWDSSPSGPSCPEGERCFRVATSRSDFEALLNSQRERGLEIVDFDARISRTSQIFAGVWETRRDDLPHDLHAGLSWEGFLSEHLGRTRDGNRLISFKAYEDGARQRVAGIWRPADGDGWPPERVVHDLDWKWLLETDREMRAGNPSYYLSEIEVYPRADGPDEILTAGLWQAGDLETMLLRGLRCEERGQRIEVPSGPGVVNVLFFSDCPLLRRLEALNAEGFQAVDFERYHKANHEEWAVLLHRREGPDWLLFAAAAPAIENREGLLNPSSSEGLSPEQDPDLRAFPFRLLDVDLLELERVLDDDVTHMGVLHDGGTAGPP